MREFLDQGISDALQLIDLPVSFVGLVLAGLEIWMPDKARRFESWLIRISKDPGPLLQRIWRAIGERTRIGLGSLALAAALMRLFAWLLALAFEEGPIGAGLRRFGEIASELGYWVVSVIAAWILLPLVLILLAFAVRLAGRWAGGRALGAVGIALSVASLLFAGYQVLVLTNSG